MEFKTRDLDEARRLWRKVCHQKRELGFRWEDGVYIVSFQRGGRTMLRTGATLKLIQDRIEELQSRMDLAKREGAWSSVIGYEQSIFELKRLLRLIQEGEAEQ